MYCYAMPCNPNPAHAFVPALLSFHLLFADHDSAGHHASLPEGLGKVYGALILLLGEVRREASDGELILGLEHLRDLEEGRVGGEGLDDVARVCLQAQTGLVALRGWLLGACVGDWGGCRGGDLGGYGRALSLGLGELGLAAALFLVRLDLGADALLLVLVVELLLALLGGFLDLFPAGQVLLQVLYFSRGLLADFLARV